ncbi:Aldolase-type TIM barrel [Penicillium expansum]|uniref:Aldolase-type TIM barrel n=1 Tax=Penicillium expansum TaxID=27334 RepID=A0A0A2JQI4_PENEN|nr:Aldolase-type TIM barrel [Penicillium expansum]KGO47439.1 Aldolase-type TIM barrel [Penicillium expansum]KGO54525.1 Aldolase-type TIM barrel [Penicillium expansum]KGO71847.1 Aldolase-type TIM barrel [Penicillium expansum]
MGSTSFRCPPIHQAEGLPYFTPANNAGAAINPRDPDTPTLFRPLQIRDATFKNRVIVAPMCMYSTESDPTSPAVGALTDFHIAHLGHLATKGVGLILIEATSVQFNGRISPNDSGLWQEGTDSEQFKGLCRVVNFVHSQGAKIGIQLAHAGRKASTAAPWLASQANQRGIKADESVGGWPSNVVGPSGGEEQIWAPGDQFWPPRELETAEVEEVVRAFARSAGLAVQAGVDVIEIHGAHGYLIHQFLSPVTNRRTDKYGGSFENRTRFLREVAAAIRAVVPSGMPLFLRISATDWLENQTVAAGTGSWDIASSIQLAKLLPDLGIDFLDVSSGGNHRSQRIEPHTNYQIDLAGQIRQEIHAANHTTLVGAVGFITEAESARDIVQGAEEEAQATEAMLSGPNPRADAVLMARQFLREPEWVLTAAKKLGVKVSLPWQFARGLL